MAISIYIASPSDPTLTSKLVNLTALDEGGTTGFGLTDAPDFGTIETETVFVTQFPTPGGVYSGRRHPVTRMTLPLYATGYGNLTNLMRDVEKLAEALDAGGTMVVLLDGAKRYIDFYPSQVWNPFRGQPRALQKLALQFQDPDGYPLEVMRHPYARLDPISVGVKRLKNVEGQRTYQINPQGFTSSTVGTIGNVPALAKVTVTPTSTATKTVEWSVGMKTAGLPFEFADLCSGRCGAVSTVISWAGGVTSDSLRKVFSKTITGSPRALQGTYRVFLSVDPGNQALLDVQLRWGVASTDPVETTMPFVRLDGRTGNANATGGNAVPVELGVITIPSGADTLVLEFWAKKIGTLNGGTTEFVQWFLMPIDESYTVVSLPGWRVGSTGATTWRGQDDLEFTTGSADWRGADSEVAMINVQTEVLSTKPSATPGTTLSAGRHVVAAQLTLQDNAKGTNDLVKLKVMNTVGPAMLVEKTVTMRGKRQFQKGWWRIQYDAATSEVNRRIDIAAMTGAGYGTGDTKVFVHKIMDTVLRTTTLPMVLDAADQSATVRTVPGDDRTQQLVAQGPFLEIPAGRSTLVFHFGELPNSNFPYDTFDTKGPAADEDWAGNGTAAWDVSIVLIPRIMPI